MPSKNRVNDKYKIEGIIFDAMTYFPDGEDDGSSQQLAIYYSTPTADADGNFDANFDINIPVEHNMDITEEYLESLIGKTINIDISIK